MNFHGHESRLNKSEKANWKLSFRNTRFQPIAEFQTDELIVPKPTLASGA
jgi:hypothetical protein